MIESPAYLENLKCWEWKEMEEISKRLTADHCNRSDLQTTWTFT